MLVRILLQIWDFLTRWTKVIWVCRVSATSAFLALMLFLLAEPARDLFLERESYNLYSSVYFGLVLGWAIIVHYVARKALEQQAWAIRDGAWPPHDRDLRSARDRYRLAAAWVPRLLGLLCIVSVLYGVVQAAIDIRPIEDVLGLKTPFRLLGYAAVVLLSYGGYIVLRRAFVDSNTRYQSWPTYLSEFVWGRDQDLLIESEPFWFFRRAPALGAKTSAHRKPGALDAASILLMIALVGIWIALLVWPDWIEWLAPRAVFVVFVLSLPVVLLGFLSMLSHRYRFPFIAAPILGFAILTGGLSATFHDLRPLTGASADRVSRSQLADAVRRWKKGNCGTSQGECTAQPIIIASAGGASRAAFFSASVVGAMLDDDRIDLRHRLFAISGVSGGAVGAAAIRAALDDSGGGKAAPCMHVQPSWFKSSERSKGPYTWKECLQILTSGDFLSRPFVGLVFRDLFGFPLHHLKMKDRAVLLEEAIEEHYEAVVPSDSKTGDVGLRRALGDFTGAQDRWTPLLLLNTTSARDGRRSIVSDLLPFQCNGQSEKRLFRAAVDLFETYDQPDRRPNRCSDEKTAPDAVPPQQAFRLSTSAVVSARFPIISPQAGIRRPCSPEEAKCGGGGLTSSGATPPKTGSLVDMLVDGGYFENEGLTTARELAQAISELGGDLEGLKPVIVHITNTPISETGEGQGVPSRDKLLESWHATFTAPFGALVGTRDGHAAEAFNATSDALDKGRDAKKEPSRLISFRVYDKATSHDDKTTCSLLPIERSAGAEKPADRIKSLSMSWWLSGAVQSYLDNQLCHSKNIERFEELIKAANSP
ncbi:hypothetical protein [Methylorubrum sp. SB2]|uniref:hypothetical protein n=1 Tax=Methylorubrum subtropicum TaxID=3138812 RepID=UPI00313B1D6D